MKEIGKNIYKILNSKKCLSDDDFTKFNWWKSFAKALQNWIFCTPEINGGGGEIILKVNGNMFVVVTKQNENTKIKEWEILTRYSIRVTMDLDWLLLA